MKGKKKVVSPSLFEETIEHKPLKELKLKKVEVKQTATEQTLFDIPALPVQTKRHRVKEVEKPIVIQDVNTACYKALFPFNHEKFGINACFHKGESIVSDCGNKIREVDNSYNHENYHKQ